MSQLQQTGPHASRLARQKREVSSLRPGSEDSEFFIALPRTPTGVQTGDHVARWRHSVQLPQLRGRRADARPNGGQEGPLPPLHIHSCDSIVNQLDAETGCRTSPRSESRFAITSRRPDSGRKWRPIQPVGQQCFAERVDACQRAHGIFRVDACRRPHGALGFDAGQRPIDGIRFDAHRRRPISCGGTHPHSAGTVAHADARWLGRTDASRADAPGIAWRHLSRLGGVRIGGAGGERRAVVSQPVFFAENGDGATSETNPGRQSTRVALGTEPRRRETQPHGKDGPFQPK